MLVLLLILLSTIGCNKNIIKNPSFEEFNSLNKSMNWNVDSLADFSSDSHSGQFSLHWKQVNKTVVNSQFIDLDKDFKYEVCVHFKLKDIRGYGFRFYIGNMNYTPGYSDYNYVPKYYNGTTNGWQKACYKTKTIMRPRGGNLDTYIFIFFTTPDESEKGEVFIDDISIYRINDCINITINNDRDEVYDKVNLVYSLNVIRGNYALNDWNLIIRIKDNSQVINEKKIESIKSSFSTIPVDISKLNLANNKFYQIEVELKCLKDETSVIKSYTFKKINKIERKITFDEYGRMFINNELFFPLGLCVAYGHENELKEINRTHLNFILLPYYESDKNQILKTLDTIHTTQNGRLKVLYYIRNFKFEINIDKCEISNLEEGYKEITDTINRFKNHPSIMAWFVNDELPECFNEYIRNKTLMIHELDPDHPTVSTETTRKHSQSFINTTDVYGIDCYPIGVNNSTENVNCYRFYNLVYNDVLKSKPMWPVGQIYDLIGILSKGNITRPPTLQEMKTMSWQAFVAGAKGLFFYSTIELYALNKVTPFETRWKEIIELTDQIWEYKDIILSIEKVHKIEYDENKNVAFRQWKYNGYYYIVIVNLGRQNETLEINLLNKYSVNKEFGLGTFKQHKNNITFYIKPIDVLMIKYKLDSSHNSNWIIIVIVLIIIILISIIIVYIVKKYHKKDDEKIINDKGLLPLTD